MLSRLALTLREVLLAVLLMRAAVSQRPRLQAGLPWMVLKQKVLLQRAPPQKALPEEVLSPALRGRELVRQMSTPRLSLVPLPPLHSLEAYSLQERHWKAVASKLPVGCCCSAFRRLC